MSIANENPLVAFLGLDVGLTVVRCSGKVHINEQGAKHCKKFADELYTGIGEGKLRDTIRCKTRVKKRFAMCVDVVLDVSIARTNF